MDMRLSGEILKFNNCSITEQKEIMKKFDKKNYTKHKYNEYLRQFVDIFFSENRENILKSLKTLNTVSKNKKSIYPDDFSTSAANILLFLKNNVNYNIEKNDILYNLINDYYNLFVSWESIHKYSTYDGLIENYFDIVLCILDDLEGYRNNYEIINNSMKILTEKLFHLSPKMSFQYIYERYEVIHKLQKISFYFWENVEKNINTYFENFVAMFLSCVTNKLSSLIINISDKIHFCENNDISEITKKIRENKLSISFIENKMQNLINIIQVIKCDTQNLQLHISEMRDVFGAFKIITNNLQQIINKNKK